MFTPANERAARYARDFSRDIVRALKVKGIVITGGTWLPSANGDFANGERGYTLEDRGCHMIRTYAEVRALAA